MLIGRLIVQRRFGPVPRHEGESFSDSGCVLAVAAVVVDGVKASTRMIENDSAKETETVKVKKAL
jgi:hypothetical protein